MVEFENKIWLDVMNRDHIEKVRLWRNKAAKYGVYRTSYLLTFQMQQDFYNEIIDNRNSNNRYFGIFIREKKREVIHGTMNMEKNVDNFIGIVGLNNIQWENKIAEIAITLNPEYIGKGYGEKAFRLCLREGFLNLGILNIFGECYKCNPNLAFWEKMINKYRGYKTMLPSRKFYNGSYHDSIYFNFNAFDSLPENNGGSEL
jgi:RimJ/RimL family protein N-acetyltransferase